MMARGDSLMCSRNPGSNYKSGLIAPKRIPTSVPTTRQQNNKSFMRCRTGKARWRTTMRPYIERGPFLVASVELGGYRSVLNVPMLKEGALVGAISIFRQE